MHTVNEKGVKVPNNCWYTPHEIIGEVNEEPSLTAPGQSYGIREIIEKRIRGINLPVSLNGEYSEDNIDSPDMTKFIDITEVEEMKRQVDERIELTKSKKSAKNRDLESEIPKPDFSTKISEGDEEKA